MSFFHAKDRTVMSPINPKLEPLYDFLKQYQKTFSGSNFYDELIENYEYLDQVFKDEIVPGNVIFHAWECTSGCGHTTLMDKYLKGKRIYCSNCGCKTEMNYLGETTLVNVSAIPNNFTLGRKKQ